MRNWLYILLGIIVLAFVIHVLGIKRKKRIKNKLNELQEERQKSWRETNQKEYLRSSLNKKLAIRSRLTSIVILSIFIVASMVAGLLSMGKIDIATAFFGGGIVEIVIIVTSQLIINRPHEVKYYLGQIEPYLRGKIFANYHDLDTEIENGHKRIAVIDVQIQRLQRMIAA